MPYGPGYRSRSIFQSKTFFSKLFLKLTRENIPPSIVCQQILKYELENRSKENIATIVPWLASIPKLFAFLSGNEAECDILKIFKQFGEICFYLYFKKGAIIKRYREKKDIFYLLFDGNLAELTPVFYQKCGSIREFLAYGLKLHYGKEEQLVRNGIAINKHNLLDFNMDIYMKTNNLLEAIKTYTSANSDEAINITNLNSTVINELKTNNIDMDNIKQSISSIDTYIYITKFLSNNRKENLIDIFEIRERNVTSRHIVKRLFTVSEIKLVNILTKGETIGNFNTNEITMHNNIYISIDNCDIGVIDKKMQQKAEIFNLMKRKINKLLLKYQFNFFIFQNLSPIIFENYTKYFSYKMVKKGEKLFVQDSKVFGVYLLLQGKIEIYTEKSFNEIDSGIGNLENSFDGFREYASPVEKTRNNAQSENSEYLLNPIFKSDTFLEESKQPEKIVLTVLNNKEVINGNHGYNNKTQIYNFTAECISDSGIVLCIPRDYYNYIVEKERSVEETVLQILDMKLIYYIQKGKRYKEDFIKKIKKKSDKSRTIFKQSMQFNKSINQFSNTRTGFYKVNNSIINRYNIKTITTNPIIQNQMHQYQRREEAYSPSYTEKKQGMKLKVNNIKEIGISINSPDGNNRIDHTYRFKHTKGINSFSSSHSPIQDVNAMNSSNFSFFSLRKNTENSDYKTCKTETFYSSISKNHSKSNSFLDGYYINADSNQGKRKKKMVKFNYNYISNMEEIKQTKGDKKINLPSISENNKYNSNWFFNKQDHNEGNNKVHMKKNMSGNIPHSYNISNESFGKHLHYSRNNQL